MFPIYFDADKTGLSFIEFEKQFLNICKLHQEEGRAKAFAFILYDLTDAHIRMMLDKEEYYAPLNDISGKHLTIFFLHVYKPKVRKQFKGSSKEPVMEYLTKASISVNPSDGYNSILKEYFNFNEEIRFPAILFFQVSESKVVDAHLIQLLESRIESAYNEILKIIKTSVDVIKSDSDNGELFSKIKDQVGDNSMRVFAQKVRDAKPIAEILYIIKKIYSA